MVRKRFSTIPRPIILNTWSSTDVLASLNYYRSLKGLPRSSQPPFSYFFNFEITSKDILSSGIVIIYDDITQTFSMETYDSTKSYSENTFEITSTVLGSPIFRPATSLGIFVQIGLLPSTTDTVLWVDSLIRKGVRGSMNISRIGDGGGGGGLTPARIPAP